MEYEMSGEERLFDDSTNPSLKHDDQQAIRNQSSVKPEDYSAEKRREQTGVPIPEEDHQLS